MIQNRRVNWETCQIGIPGATAKDKENRRVPFNPEGRLAAILKRRAALGPDAFVFGSETGGYQPIQTAWETLKLLAYGHEPRPGREGVAWNREQLQRIDLRWHDLRHHAEPWIMPSPVICPRSRRCGSKVIMMYLGRVRAGERA